MKKHFSASILCGCQAKRFNKHLCLPFFRTHCQGGDHPRTALEHGRGHGGERRPPRRMDREFQEQGVTRRDEANMRLTRVPVLFFPGFNVLGFPFHFAVLLSRPAVGRASHPITCVFLYICLLCYRFDHAIFFVTFTNQMHFFYYCPDLFSFSVASSRSTYLFPPSCTYLRLPAQYNTNSRFFPC